MISLLACAIWESLEVDEIAFVLLALAIGLAWFSVRRWRTARRELDRRIALERALDERRTEQDRLAREVAQRRTDCNESGASPQESAF